MDNGTPLVMAKLRLLPSPTREREGGQPRGSRTMPVSGSTHRENLTVLSPQLMCSRPWSLSPGLPDHRSPREGPASTSSSQASNSSAQRYYWDSPLQCQPKPSDRSTSRLPPSTAASICSGLILRVREGNRPVPTPCHLSTKHSRSHVENLFH